MKGAIVEMLTQNSLLRWSCWLEKKRVGKIEGGWKEEEGGKFSIFPLFCLDVVN